MSAPGVGRCARDWLRRNRAGLLALFLYGTLLLALRPATPFEWDEILYQRALDHYDVALHSPQPPGVPAYIAAAKVVSYLTRDPMRALQFVAIVSALAALLLLYRLARALGTTGSAGVAAAAMLAVVPGFTFAANIGLSDVPATAGALGAVLMCVLAVTNTRRLPWAAATVAFALSLRPQIVVVLLPAGLAAVVMAARRRQWRSLGAGALSGAGVSAVIWVPAVLLTGFSRYLSATLAQAHWVATAEAGYRLPALRLGDALTGWFVDPLGSHGTAAGFWLLVVIGAAVWWAAGRRWLVAAAGLSGGAYLLVAMFTMNVLSAARYSLPGLAFFALLASGVAAAPARWPRRTGIAAVGLWSAAAFSWGAPVYLLRREPAPVWAGLTWVKDHCAPAMTRVVFDGVATPQVRYVLGRAGFQIVEMQRANLVLDGPPQPGEQTLFVTPLPVPACDVLFQRSWHSRRLAQLTFRRYQTCAVSRVRSSDAAVFSPEWQLRKDGWQLWGTGVIRLQSGARPAVVRLCAGRQAITLTRPGFAVETIAPGRCVMVPLLPGAAGALAVGAPPDAATLVPPIQILQLSALDASSGLASAYMVPQAAHTRGLGGSNWRTDLVIFNPQQHPLGVTAQFLATGRDNEVAPMVSDTLAPGQVLDVPDVLSLPEFRSSGKLGALLVYATAGGRACTSAVCNFLVLSRTYNAHASSGAWRADEWMGGVSPSAALAPGETAVVRHVTRSATVGASIGVASWSVAPVRVRVSVLDARGARVEAREIDLAPFGHLHVPLAANVDDGRVEFEIAGGNAEARVVPYVSMVDLETGLPVHLLPDSASGHGGPAAWTPPLPRVAAPG